MDREPYKMAKKYSLLNYEWDYSMDSYDGRPRMTGKRKSAKRNADIIVSAKSEMDCLHQIFLMQMFLLECREDFMLVRDICDVLLQKTIHQINIWKQERCWWKLKFYRMVKTGSMNQSTFSGHRKHPAVEITWTIHMIICLIITMGCRAGSC